MIHGGCFPAYLMGLLLTLAASVSLAQDAAAPTTRPLSPVARPIRLESDNDGQIVSVALDAAVFTNSRLDLADLRILDSSDQNVPFVVRKKRSTTFRDRKLFRSTPPPTVTPKGNEQLQIEFSFSDNHPWDRIEGLALDTSQQNFEHRLSVEYRRKGEAEWQTLTEDALIYDYNQFMDVRNTEVAFEQPLNRPAGCTLRLEIQQVIQRQESNWLKLTRSTRGNEPVEAQETLMINRQPLRLEAVRVWRTQKVTDASELQLQNYPITLTRLTPDPESKESRWSLASQFEPLSELNLQTSDDNFSRQIRLETIDEDSVTRLSSDRITKIHIGDVEKEQLEVHFTESRHDRYQLIVVNDDSPEISHLSVTASGPIYEAVFLSAPGQMYRLAYGNPLAIAPQFDTAALNVALQNDVPLIEAALESPEPFQWQETIEPQAYWWNNTWVLTTIVIVLMVVLGWTLRTAAHRLEQIPSDS